MKITKHPVIIIKKAFRITDTVTLSVLITLMVMPFLDMTHHAWIVIPVFLSIFLLAVSVRRRHQTIRKKQIEFEKTNQRKVERLLLCSDEELASRFKKNQFILIRKERPDRFDVMEAIRKQADAIGILAEDETLRKLVLFYAPDTAIYSLHDLIDNEKSAEAGKGVSNKILSYMIKNKYFMLSIMFLLASFLLRAKIYYRTIAALCLIIASFQAFSGNRNGARIS